jgi:hypothetical protein
VESNRHTHANLPSAGLTSIRLPHPYAQEETKEMQAAYYCDKTCTELHFSKDQTIVEQGLKTVTDSWTECTYDSTTFHFNLSLTVGSGRLSFFMPDNRSFQNAFMNIDTSNPLYFYVIAQGGLQNGITMTYLGAINMLPHPKDNTILTPLLSLALAARQRLWQIGGRSFLRLIIRTIFNTNDENYYVDFFLPNVVRHYLGDPQYFNALRVTFARYLDLKKRNPNSTTIVRAKEMLYQQLGDSNLGFGYLEPLMAGLISFHLRTYGNTGSHRHDLEHTPNRLLTPRQKAYINMNRNLSRFRGQSNLPRI